MMNNVETFWWAERLLNGEVKDGGGQRIYSLSGAVRKPGVYEAPVGISARELLEQYGGGMVDDAEIGWWIPGGAATGVLPRSLIDTPVFAAGLNYVGFAPVTAPVVCHPAPPGALQAAPRS